MTMMPSKQTLLHHAQDYRDQAERILSSPSWWIEGDPTARAAEKIELAEYFERLASK
jgi:hypothetical protein